MKIILFFVGICAAMPLECCFCRGTMDDVQEPCLLKNNESMLSVRRDPLEVQSVQQRRIFFESLAHNREQRPLQRLVLYPGKKLVSQKKNNGSDHEEAWYKELRESFERGEFNAVFGVYKDFSPKDSDQQLTETESEEAVAARVIKELRPGKVFSKDQAQECHDYLTFWMLFVGSYGIGVPRDYLTTSHYLKNLLEAKD